MAISDSKAKLPRDQNAQPMQVLSPNDASVASASLAVTTATLTLTGLDSDQTNIVEVASLEDCHIKFGGSGVSATTSSRVFPKGVAVYTLQSDQTHMAHILAAGGSAAKITVTTLI